MSVGTIFSNESRLAVGGALNAKLAHPGLGWRSRIPRGALGPIHHFISPLKGEQDMTSLHFFQGSTEGARTADSSLPGISAISGLPAEGVS